MAVITRMVFVIVTLIIAFCIAALVANFLDMVAETSARMSARTMAVELSGIISELIGAPENTTSNYSLPATQCKIKITGTSIDVTAKEQFYSSPYLISDQPIEIKRPNNIACNENKKRVMVFKRTADKILVKILG